MARLPAPERRAQLLRVAAELFATRGYARTTTAQLSKAAGVSEPIIYRHFKSKRELFVALVEQTGERTIELWSRALEDASGPEQRLDRLLGANVMVTDASARAAYRVILQAITEVDDPEIRSAIDAHFHALHSFLSEEIRRGQDGRQVGRRFDPELIGWVLINVALGYGVLDALGISGHGHDERGVRVQDVVRSLLLPRLRTQGGHDGGGGE